MGDGKVKKCLKSDEPALLTAYRAAKPNATWDEMKEDAFDNGQRAARETKISLVRTQRCLCAYCETRIADSSTDNDLEARKRDQCVEHFHPKSDPTRPPNWHLHWPNLWAVCRGGIDGSEKLPALSENMSCDAFKGHQIQKHKLPLCPEGRILAPDQVPAFPPLLSFAPSGAPEPHLVNCAATTIPGNQCTDTASLVSNTIEHLNLGCARLNNQRRVIRRELEQQITLARRRAAGQPVELAMRVVVRRFFRMEIDSPWPQFFSLIRSRLGEIAEQHLQSIGFRG